MVQEDDIDDDGEPDWRTTWTDTDLDGRYDKKEGTPLMNGETGPVEEEVVDTPVKWQPDLNRCPRLLLPDQDGRLHPMFVVFKPRNGAYPHGRVSV